MERNEDDESDGRRRVGSESVVDDADVDEDVDEDGWVGVERSKA